MSDRDLSDVPSAARIVRTPGTCGGLPRIDGTRITVMTIKAYAAGLGVADIDKIREAYPSLTDPQIHAALDYVDDAASSEALATSGPILSTWAVRGSVPIDGCKHEPGWACDNCSTQLDRAHALVDELRRGLYATSEDVIQTLSLLYPSEKTDHWRTKYSQLRDVVMGGAESGDSGHEHVLEIAVQRMAKEDRKEAADLREWLRKYGAGIPDYAFMQLDGIARSLELRTDYPRIEKARAHVIEAARALDTSGTPKGITSVITLDRALAELSAAESEVQS